jgi:hypothetical protein
MIPFAEQTVPMTYSLPARACARATDASANIFVPFLAPLLFSRAGGVVA